MIAVIPVSVWTSRRNIKGERGEPEKKQREDRKENKTERARRRKKVFLSRPQNMECP
jgi:hypothetical protein